MQWHRNLAHKYGGMPSDYERLAPVTLAYEACVLLADTIKQDARRLADVPADKAERSKLSRERNRRRNEARKGDWYAATVVELCDIYMSEKGH